MDKKIIQKGYLTPKVRKSHVTRVKGWERLQKQALKMIVDANRLAASTPDLQEQHNAMKLAAALRAAMAWTEEDWNGKQGKVKGAPGESKQLADSRDVAGEEPGPV